MCQHGGRRSRIIVDDTGEILAEEKNGDRIKYVKSTSIKAYSKIKRDRVVKRQREIDSKQYHILTIDNFYKGNIVEIRKTMQNLSIYEKAFLYSMASYVGYEDCCLKYDNGKEINIDKMVEFSGISKRKLQDVIKDLTQKNILYKRKKNNTLQFFINPKIFCKGTRIAKESKEMFKNNDK